MRIIGLIPLTAMTAAFVLPVARLRPNYQRPSAPSAPCFKGVFYRYPPNPPDGGWKLATPNDSAIRGKWWRIYEDPQLNQLEEKVSVSNQTLKASYEQYMRAKAGREYRSSARNISRPFHSRPRFARSSMNNRPLHVPRDK